MCLYWCKLNLPPKNNQIKTNFFHLQSWNVSGSELNIDGFGYDWKSSFCFSLIFCVQLNQKKSTPKTQLEGAGNYSDSLDFFSAI